MLANMDKLTIVRIGNVISYSTLHEIGERLREGFEGIIRDVQLTHHESPVAGSIDAFLLTMILHSEFKGHTLGITDAELKTRDEDEFYHAVLGGKNPRNDVAVVSTRKLSPERIESAGDYQLLVDRTLKVCLHEVGHNMGLTDHGSYTFAADGQLCPMSKGERNRFGYQGYVRAVVDGRGDRFCNGCKRFLETVHAHHGSVH